MEVFNKLLEAVGKIVPNANERQKLEAEIKKAEIELEKNIQDNFRVKSDSWLMRYTFPILVWVMSLQMAWNAFAPIIWTIFSIKKEMPIVRIDEFHAYVIITYCGFFFGGNTIKKSKDVWSHLFKR